MTTPPSDQPASEPTPPAPRQRRRWPVAALVAGAAIVALEAWVGLYPGPFTDGLYKAAVAKRHLMADPTRLDDVAFFGDSRTFSVRADLVAKALAPAAPKPLAVTNYSWAFMGAESYGYALDAYIGAKGHPPRLILVNPFPEAIALPPRITTLKEQGYYKTRLFTAFPTKALMRDLALERHDYALAWELLTHLCLPPTVKFRESNDPRKGVKPVLAALARGHGLPEPTQVELAQVNGMRERGAYTMYLDEVVTTANLAQVERIIGPYGDYETSNAAPIAAYEAFIQKADKLGIDVRVLGMPYAQSLAEAYESHGALTKYFALIDKWKAKYPRFGTIGETTGSTVIVYPDEFFGDAGHVNLKGEARYEKDYQAMLASWRQRTGWK